MFSYKSLLIERILFDFRRALPIFLACDGYDREVSQGYFIQPTEFIAPDQQAQICLTLTGDTDGHVVVEDVSKDHAECAVHFSKSQAEFLLSLVKKAELSPKISVYPCHDLQLKQIVTSVKYADLETLLDTNYAIERVTETILPTIYDQHTSLIAYRIMPGLYEYYALMVNQPDLSKPVNIRLHAECLTGDLFGSLRCDCRPQLHKALKEFSQKPEGGVIIYIRQEGRNIGLMNKLKAYALQNKGYDTVDANLMLGFKLDERDYQAAIMILQDLEISTVNIFTNNPEKIAALEQHNIKINNRVAHYTQPQSFNEEYINTKKKRIGHLPNA